MGATSRQGQDVAVAFEAKIAQLQRAIANDTPGAREELANVIRDRDGVAAAIADIEKKLAANEDPATWANVTPKSRARAEQADTRAQLQKQLQDLKVFGLKVAKMNPTERQNLQNFFRLAKEDPEAFKRFVEGNKPGAQPAPAPTQGPAPVNTTPTGAPANIQAAIDFGLTQLGAPYVGGASPYRFGTPGDGRTYQMEGQHAYVSPKGVIGYDCSGLMVTMLKKAGIDLSGMASSRGMLKLPEVPKDQLQPGDLLVKNGHVAMYIGNGQMIESVPGGVRVAPASKYIYDPAYSGRHPG
ncbi:MAG: C40 family peptidase [Myxococcaceae bacterium]|nr:C40 family peptidase [Myxococcaceae bacterium]